MTSHGNALVRERRLIHTLAIVLALLVTAPFPWLLQMSSKTNAQIFTFPPPLIFTPTLDN